MASRLDIRTIVSHHFKPYRFGKGRRFGCSMLVIYILLPTAVATFGALIGPVSEQYQVVFFAVFSIAAAVLTALLAVVHNLVGATDLSRTYGPHERVKRARQILKLEVLRDLYANVSYTVLVLLLAIVPLLCLRFFAPLPSLDSASTPQPLLVVVLERILAANPPPSPSLSHVVVERILSGLVYFAAVSLACSLFQSISGVYLVLDRHADGIADAIKKGPEG